MTKKYLQAHKSHALNVRLYGDPVAAENLRPHALLELQKLHNAMMFQNLKQDARQTLFTDGARITCLSCFGQDTIKIYVPPRKAEEVGESLVIVAIGNDSIGYYYIACAVSGVKLGPIREAKTMEDIRRLYPPAIQKSCYKFHQQKDYAAALSWTDGLCRMDPRLPCGHPDANENYCCDGDPTKPPCSKECSNRDTEEIILKGYGDYGCAPPLKDTEKDINKLPCTDLPECDEHQDGLFISYIDHVAWWENYKYGGNVVDDSGDRYYRHCRRVFTDGRSDETLFRTFDPVLVRNSNQYARFRAEFIDMRTERQRHPLYPGDGSKEVHASICQNQIRHWWGKEDDSRTLQEIREAVRQDIEDT